MRIVVVLDGWQVRQKLGNGCQDTVEAPYWCWLVQFETLKSKDFSKFIWPRDALKPLHQSTYRPCDCCMGSKESNMLRSWLVGISFSFSCHMIFLVTWLFPITWPPFLGTNVPFPLLFSFLLFSRLIVRSLRELYCSLLIVPCIKLLSHGSCPHVYKLAYI